MTTSTPPPPRGQDRYGLEAGELEPSPSAATSRGVQNRILEHDRSAKFDYDSTELQPDDVRVLSQVATCLTTGPLKGRNVELVGRADPRGTDQYNMALGANRAHRITTFLVEHGASAKLRETSRGAIDATGHDEAGWRTDRRVDLVLGS